MRIPHISSTFSLPLSLRLYPSLSFIPSVLSSLCPSPPHPNSVFVKHCSRIKVAEILIPAEVCALSVGIKNQVEDRWRQRDEASALGVIGRQRKMDGGCKVAHFAAHVGSPCAKIMAH